MWCAARDQLIAVKIYSDARRFVTRLHGHWATVHPLASPKETIALLRCPDVPVKAPWRPDVRQAEGVLHGAYVFYGVASVFDAIFRRYGASRRGLRRLLVWRTCVDEGLGQLRQAAAAPTAVGEALINRLAEENGARLRELSANHPPDAAWAASAIREHLRTAGTSQSREPWFLAM